MQFAGERRFDTGGGVPDYRNLTTSFENSSQWQIVEEFFNGQARGRLSYTLRQPDPDHLAMQISGREILLRRCS